MSPESQWDVQTALKSTLDAAPALTTLLAGGSDSIYDHVPQNATFPYVVIGGAQAQSWDTQTSTGLQQTITIETWSRHRGMKEVKQIMQAIYDALHRQTLTITNQTQILCQFTVSEVFLERDGLTRRGIQSFTILTEPS